jgi:transcriptional regulator with XRE-family HTH domain
MDEPRNLDESVGNILRRRRRELGLTLQELAEQVGCARSYLSQVENDKRPNPPGEALLMRLEGALGLERGELVEAARWAQTPASVRREARRLAGRERDAQRLAALLREDGVDEAYRSGELRRLVERLAPDEGEGRGDGDAGPGEDRGDVSDRGNLARAKLPVEVPLINRVAAGYPCEFTDLGYPARVADEYVQCPDLGDPDAFAARVVGDSMEPVYREGDVVVFSPARGVVSGSDCFVRLEHDAHTTFLRVYFEGDGERELIRLQPLNSDYPPRVLGREEVAGLYRAVSVTRWIG